MRKKIFLDTNFLLIPFQFNVDIFAELNKLMPEAELVIADLTFKELENIIINPDSSFKDKKTAGSVKKLLKRKNLKIIRTSGYNVIDDFLVENVELFDFVATQDKELKKKLKNRTRFVILKSKTHLELL